MSQPAPAHGDARDDQTGRFVVQPNGRVRPLSPHLQVWRWHVTMLGSILHRGTGMALAFGVVLVGAWLACLAFGPEAYGAFARLSGSPIGLLVWFGLTVALFFHLAAGVRHLIWDAGAAMAPKAASALTWWAIIIGVVGAVAFWAALFATGSVSL
jgi:succinate dehydrogenase / fumarate reductase cytochrome b subunit